MTYYGWHFIKETYKLRDGTPVKAGSITEVHYKPFLCVRGLHACQRVVDALAYAPGPILCRVKVSGDIDSYGDKFCGKKREIIWTLDANDLLHKFALWLAKKYFKSCNFTPESTSIIEEFLSVKEKYIKGEISEETLINKHWDLQDKYINCGTGNLILAESTAHPVAIKAASTVSRVTKPFSLNSTTQNNKLLRLIKETPYE